jgi:hypothetical protein
MCNACVYMCMSARYSFVSLVTWSFIFFPTVCAVPVFVFVLLLGLELLADEYFVP